MSSGLRFLGTITIRQNGAVTEATAARYGGGGEDESFTGRYWSLSPHVELRPGPAMIRFHDGFEAGAELTRVGPDSGYFAKPSYY